jgi:hypothetical protein
VQVAHAREDRGRARRLDPVALGQRLDRRAFVVMVVVDGRAPVALDVGEQLAKARPSSAGCSATKAR